MLLSFCQSDFERFLFWKKFIIVQVSALLITLFVPTLNYTRREIFFKTRYKGYCDGSNKTYENPRSHRKNVYERKKNINPCTKLNIRFSPFCRIMGVNFEPTWFPRLQGLVTTAVAQYKSYKISALTSTNPFVANEGVAYQACAVEVSRQIDTSSTSHTFAHLTLVDINARLLIV